MQLGSEIFDVIEKPNPDVFLTMSHPAQEVLQTTALLKKSMTFVPTSTSSETHKRLKEELHKQQQSSNIIVGSWATTDDPEKIKREAEKAEEINLKARRKLEQKRRQLEGMDGYDLGGSSRGDRGAASSSRYDSQDGYNEVGRGGDQYEEDDFVVHDEEDDDEDDARGRRLKDLKRKGAESYKKNRKHSSEEEDEELEELDEEEEEEEAEAAFTDEESDGRSNRRSSAKKRRIIGDDDEDED